MSCWVVPAIAAELWEVPIAEILRRIHNGVVPFRREQGFLFVDVAPYSPVYTPAAREPREESPPTYTIITPEESEALAAVTDAGPDEHTEVEAIAAEVDAVDVDADPLPQPMSVEIPTMRLVVDTIEDWEPAAESVEVGEDVEAQPDLDSPRTEAAAEAQSDEAEPEGAEADDGFDEHTRELSWRDWHRTRAQVGRTRRPPALA